MSIVDKSTYSTRRQTNSKFIVFNSLGTPIIMRYIPFFPKMMIQAVIKDTNWKAGEFYINPRPSPIDFKSFLGNLQVIFYILAETHKNNRHLCTDSAILRCQYVRTHPGNQALCQRPTHTICSISCQLISIIKS